MMRDSSQRPSTVRRLPVQLVSTEPCDPLNEEAGRLVNAPKPSLEILRCERQPVFRQCHLRRCPAVGRCWRHAVAPPNEPLVDLVQMIENVVQHTAKSLARRVRPVSERGAYLLGRIVLRETHQVAARLGVRRFKML